MSTTSLYSSTSRVTGMYSELDTDSLVEAACSNIQTKIDSAQQQEQLLTWKNEALTTIYDDIDDFISTWLNSTSDTSVLLSNSLYCYDVTDTSSSNDDSVTIEASGSSCYTGDISVSVSQIAKQASVSSGNSKTTLVGAAEAITEDTSADTALSSLSSLTFDSDGNTSLTVNGSTFTFDKSDTIADVLSEVNTSSCGVSLSYSSSTGSFTLTSNTAGSSTITASGQLATDFKLTTDTSATLTLGSTSSGISSSGTISSSNNTTLGNLDFANSLFATNSDTISFSINGVTFEFDDDTTLQSMLSTINNSDAGVTMSYSRLTDSFTITASEGGEDSEITIENISGNAFGSSSAFGIDEGTYANGQNAIATITIDGVATTVEQDSNEFSYDGITYTLNRVTSADQEFNVTRNYSTAVDNISDFIDAFNDLITELHDYVDFDYDTDVDPDDYLPLTDDQEEEMTDDEIESWTELSQDHILRNDSDIESLLTSLSNVFYSALAGTGLMGTDLGLSTYSYYSDDAGLIEIDTDTLESALENYGTEAISALISTDSGSRGLFYQILDLLNDYQDEAEDSISSNSDKIDDYDDKVDDLEDKLETKANRLYEKYAAMETAMASLSSQSTALSTLLGS